MAGVAAATAGAGNRLAAAAGWGRGAAMAPAIPAAAARESSDLRMGFGPPCVHAADIRTKKAQGCRRKVPKKGQTVTIGDTPRAPVIRDAGTGRLISRQGRQSSRLLRRLPGGFSASAWAGRC